MRQYQRMDARPKTCERAAELVSLELDDELSRFERVLLARHLSRCAACADYAAGVTAATEALRSAPLEPMPKPVSLPVFQRRLPRIVGNVTAVAAIAVFGLWFAVSPSENARQGNIGKADVQSSLADDSSDWPGGVVPKRPPVTPFLPGGQGGLRPLVS
jgi:anti-sigma factor RsiW